MSDLDNLPGQRCPICRSRGARMYYGGERGEAGPFIYCDECGYDEEALATGRRKTVREVEKSVERIRAETRYCCPICARVSYHERDLQERFCTACGFADDIPLVIKRGLTEMLTTKLREMETIAERLAISITHTRQQIATLTSDKDLPVKR